MFHLPPLLSRHCWIFSPRPRPRRPPPCPLLLNPHHNPMGSMICLQASPYQKVATETARRHSHLAPPLLPHPTPTPTTGRMNCWISTHMSRHQLQHVLSAILNIHPTHPRHHPSLRIMICLRNYRHESLHLHHHRRRAPHLPSTSCRNHRRRNNPMQLSRAMMQ